MRAEALVVAEKNGESCYEVELYQLEGELILALSTSGEAELEASFRWALDLARGQ